MAKLSNSNEAVIGALSGTSIGRSNPARGLFENLPPTMRLSDFAGVVGISPKTLYDWHHRSSLNQVPENLFFKINRMLFVRTDVFLDWVTHQNSPGAHARAERMSDVDQKGKW